MRILAPAGESRPALYVGVDGGGTRCRLRLRDPAGRMIGEAMSGPANVNLAFDAAIVTVSELIATATGSMDDGTGPVLHIGIGLAGISSPVVAQRVQEALPIAAGTLAVASDSEIACLGAHAGADGGLIVAGTGSGAVVRLDGRTVSIGGRGFLLGDDGSGARMGLDALRRALRAHDDLAPHTSLTRALMARFGDDPVAAIAWGREARSADFADFAPAILAAARAGDAVGLAIVRQAADAIAELITAMQRRGVARISLVGGLAGALKPFLDPAATATLQDPIYDALDGALLLAGCPALAPAAEGQAR